MVKVSPDCFIGQLLSLAVWYVNGKKEKVTNEEISPVRVLKRKDGYLVVFLYPGYMDDDGASYEIAAGIVFYSKTGELLRVLERAASWANNEGTLVLRESCMTGDTISIAERWIYPDKRQEDGKVVSYKPIYDVSKDTSDLVDGNYPSQGGYECPGNSYISAGAK